MLLLVLSCSVFFYMTPNLRQSSVASKSRNTVRFTEWEASLSILFRSRTRSTYIFGSRILEFGGSCPYLKLYEVSCRPLLATACSVDGSACCGHRCVTRWHGIRLNRACPQRPCVPMLCHNWGWQLLLWLLLSTLIVIGHFVTGVGDLQGGPLNNRDLLVWDFDSTRAIRLEGS